jgi:NAD(P)H-hydrate epimerase
MERAGFALATAIRNHYAPCSIGVLTGSGHNGADSLVCARQLQQWGYEVVVYPFDQARMKPLTQSHFAYYQALGGQVVSDFRELASCSVLLDGLLGVGLSREVAPKLAAVITWSNQTGKPIVSIDLPSGLHSDSGAVLGQAIQATHTLCLGLWKQGLFQDRALAYGGALALLPLDLPWAQVLPNPQPRCITPTLARAGLPLARPLAAHKYTAGKVLIIAGSQRYPGAALLAGLGAKASGVGLVGMAVPASLRDLLLPQLPDALWYPCPETAEGAIAELAVDPTDFSAIVCGPGLTQCPELVQSLISLPLPLLLDADALLTVPKRRYPTVITPHPGEFRRLFPELDINERFAAAQAAALASGAVVVLKGARTVIATPQALWVNPSSTPALARGGSGDVLSGLLGGLLAQGIAAESAAIGAVWWHSHTAYALAEKRSVLGVDPVTLARHLNDFMA